jgi:haloacid dehalogenase-like hydrolase
MQAIIAVIFDFDDTLAPDSTSSFLERQGLDVKTFWKSVEPMVQAGWDPVPAYLYRMVEESDRRGSKRFAKADFEKHGKALKPFVGAATIFRRIKNHVASISQEAKVEFYVISSGIRTTIQASGLARHFTDIWASDFHYGANGGIVFPKNVVSFTDKTRYLFQITKGVIGPAMRSKPFEVNRKHAQSDLRVPLNNMVYVGDGYTDIPCFSLIKNGGGTAIGVYDRENREKWGRAWGFTEDGRVSNLVPADYGKKSALADSLLMATESIARRIKLAGTSYQG